jgi:hypothetical protein
MRVEEEEEEEQEEQEQEQEQGYFHSRNLEREVGVLLAADLSPKL